MPSISDCCWHLFDGPETLTKPYIDLAVIWFAVGRGSQARTQPPANDVSDAGGAQEFAPNTESDTSYTL